MRLWEQLGDWTVKAFPGARGTLLRDTERLNVFISFGPWPDRETAARWRASEEFQRHVAAHERRRLHRTLAAAPPPAHYDEAAAAVARGRHQLAAAEAEHARSTQRLEELSRARRWRRNPQGIEMARQAVQLAGQRCARATHDLDRAEARAAALHDQAPAQDLVRQRLDAVEGALTAQVEAAVSTPAPYLTAALGEAPEDSTKPTAWREAAVRIETYRHAELGRSPVDGPLVDELGLIGAIGPRPHDYLDALQWDHAAELLAPAVEPELKHPEVDLGA